ncbi:hypothetical protein Hanom_Chr02g00167031 [Helianthus anomalus]
MRCRLIPCVFEAKPNKKWTRGYGMRPWSEASCTGRVEQVSKASIEVSGELQVSGDFSGELQVSGDFSDKLQVSGEMQKPNLSSFL